MTAQTYENHAHRPTATIVGYVLVLIALIALGLRWFGIGGQVTFAIGLLGIVGAVVTLLYISRVYVTKLQDRIIKLEMRMRCAAIVTPEQQHLLSQLSIKQIVALRFASDAELPTLLERAAREQLAPREIKRAIKVWIADLDRT
jgi:hypothetical protein